MLCDRLRIFYNKRSETAPDACCSSRQAFDHRVTTPKPWPSYALARLSHLSRSTTTLLRQHLNALLQQLVQPRHLGSNTRINRPLANLNDQATQDRGVDLWRDLYLLALAVL